MAAPPLFRWRRGFETIATLPSRGKPVSRRLAYNGPMSGRIDMNRVVGSANLLFVTLDCLRYDVARHALEAGLTPHLAVADDGFAVSGDATVGQRQPTVFRVQPTMESVRQGWL